MARDLSGTPRTGIQVQADGDAHLSNFGVFGSPEGRLVFDVTDFDESLPGPWEWDVKRLAASGAIAACDNGMAVRARRGVSMAVARGYREMVGRLSRMSALDVWYELLEVPKLRGADAFGQQADRTLRRVRGMDDDRPFARFVEFVGGRARLRDDAPTLMPLEAAFSQAQASWIREHARRDFVAYRRSLSDERVHLVDGYRIADVAMRVVGTSSVGLRCLVVLLEGANGHPLVMQAKEARASVLEQYTAPSRYRNQGRRVVAGQRVMQVPSDLLLGWMRDADGRDLYWRQLRDAKAAFDLAAMGPDQLADYAEICGRCLARAHARSGDPIVLAAYLGRSDAFDVAMGAFAETYADQNERDYRGLKAAAKTGRIRVAEA
jgi:hypothetical protein